MSSLSPKKSEDDNNDEFLEEIMIFNEPSPLSLPSEKSKDDNNDEFSQEIMISNERSPSSMPSEKSKDNNDDDFLQKNMFFNEHRPSSLPSDISKDKNDDDFPRKINNFNEHSPSSLPPNESEDNDDNSSQENMSFDETNHPKILCVGLCRTDIIQVCQKYPTECSELECIDIRWERGGNASNTCTVLSQFEANVEFLGTLSDQQPKLINLIKDMDEHNIHHSHCPIKSNTTCPSASIVINSSNLTRTKWSFNPDLPELSVDEFRKINLEEYSWIHFEGRNLDNIMEMIQIIHKHNVLIRSKDFKYRLRHHDVVISIELVKELPGIFALLPFVDLIFIGENFMNSEEAQNMIYTLEYVSRIQQKPGVIIIYALDERGAICRAAKGEFTQCPAQNSVEYKPIVDIYGTSDTFNAAMIHFLNQEIIHKYGWETYDYNNADYEKVSPLDFICPNILYQALVFACRVVSAKMEFKGFNSLKDIYESLTVHQEIKL